MGVTKPQLQNIMQTRGQAFVPRDKLNYAGRVAETYLRKKIYRWEDRAALAAYSALKETNARIREYALQTAGQLRLSKIANDADSNVFRNMLNRYVDTQLTDYGKRVADVAYEYSYTAFAAGWYGRLWLLDESSHHDPRVKPSSVPQQLAQRTVVLPGLKEAVNHAGGTPFHDQFDMAVQTSATKTRRLVNSTVTAPVGVLALTQAIAATLGVNAPPKQASKGLYHAVSLPIRTSVIRSYNHASAEVYKTHTEILVGCMWVTSHDSRVCDECASHDGQVFVVNSLTGIALFGLPPDGSHFGCRCTVTPLLVPYDQSNGNANEPPDDTFGDWLIAKGFADTMTDFMQDTSLESTQL